jgi:hypothetical protein
MIDISWLQHVPWVMLGTVLGVILCALADWTSKG